MKLTIAFVVCTLQHVRRAAVLALSTAAHNKPNLIKALLPELLPLLYDQTVVKVSFPNWLLVFSLVMALGVAHNLHLGSDKLMISFFAARIDQDS